MSWLERAYEEHDQWMVYINSDPGWDALRSEPRFQALVRRMNFPFSLTITCLTVLAPLENRKEMPIRLRGDLLHKWCSLELLPYMGWLLDFHHLLKARAMSAGIPIQLVLPMTYDETKRLPQKLKTFRLRTSQDEATRAWNLHVALYYKAGGTPWRLPRHSTELTTCHVGISFYESLDKTILLTTVAQVFNERGEGTIVRGGAARISKEDRQPHLDTVGSNSILLNALNAYRSEHHNLPARVVLHKSSRYSEEEMEGFKSACEELNIDSIDLITLHDSSTRLFRNGLYPPLRGTWLSLDDIHHVLYTRGSVDFFATYPGMYAPQTLGITLDSVEQAPRFLCREILGLTKMNWNNTQFDGFDPITLRAARQVGKILKYVPIGDKTIQPRYSFYM
jgi:hypothetical protein